MNQSLRDSCSLACLLACTLACPLPACTLGSAELSARQRTRVLRHFVEPAADPEPRGNRFTTDDRAARLGQYLFWFEGFTVTDAADADSIRPTACVTCHHPALAFSDAKQVSEGALVGARVKRNAPSLYHVSHREFLFHDGRVDSVWAQALKPIEDPIEMGSNRLRVAHVIAEQAELREAYERVFGPLPALDDRARFPRDALPPPPSSGSCELDEDCLTDAGERCVDGACADTRSFGEATDRKLAQWRAAWLGMQEADRRAVDEVFVNVGKALAAFEHRLVLAPAAFDRFLVALAARDEAAMNAALDEDAQRGLELFIKVEGGCLKCHDGPDLTDEEFHNLELERVDLDAGLAPVGDRAPRDQLRRSGARRVITDPFNCLGPYSDGCSVAAIRRLRTARREAKRRYSLGRVRTPSLRNVALTAPYQHGGQHESLRDTLEFYSELPKPPERFGRRNHLVDVINFALLTRSHFDEEELRQVEAFLRSLTSDAACPEVLERPDSPSGELRCP